MPQYAARDDNIGKRISVPYDHFDDDKRVGVKKPRLLPMTFKAFLPR